MTMRDDFIFKAPEIDSYLKEDIAVIRIKAHIFDALTDLTESGKLISLIQLAERIPDVKALLIINAPGCMNEEEYDKFLHRILERGIDPYAPEESRGIVQKIDRTREINILNRAIAQLVEFKKIAVIGFQGNIVTPFFGAGLAVDFRYGAQGMSFSLAHLKYGIHPSGALPFFLPRFVSQGKAIEILFQREKITAQEALDMGLLTTILPAEDFEKHCIKEIEKLCHLDTRVIHATKLLANISLMDLRRYFDIESALLH